MCDSQSGISDLSRWLLEERFKDKFLTLMISFTNDGGEKPF